MLQSFNPIEGVQIFFGGKGGTKRLRGCKIFKGCTPPRKSMSMLKVCVGKSIESMKFPIFASTAKCHIPNLRAFCANSAIAFFALDAKHCKLNICIRYAQCKLWSLGKFLGKLS